MTHYRIEDEPDMSDPQTALAMWEAQLAALKPLAGLEARTTEAKKALGHIAQHANHENLPQMLADANAIWKTMSAMMKALKARDAALEGAKMVATAERGSRLGVLGELAALRSALARVDVSHPDISRLVANVYALIQAMEEDGDE